MRRVNKKLFLLFGLLFLAVAGITAIFNKVEDKKAIADTGTVTSYNQFVGDYTTVGQFTVNGTDAWCMEHSKTTMPAGTAVSSLPGYPKVIDESSSAVDQLMFKIMYYGEQGGYGQIPISIASSYAYTGGTDPAGFYSSHHDPGNPLTARDLYEYAQNASLPSGQRTLTLWSNGNSAYQVLGQYTFQAITYTSITVSKIWRDNSNAYSTRPSNIVFNIYQNGSYYSQVTLSGTGNTWTQEVTGLPAGYTYTVAEASTPANYSPSTSGLTVTNTLTGTTELTITKVWSDYNNADNTRPTSVQIQILQNGNLYSTETVTGTGNTWTRTITGLPLYDANGVRYTYTINEANVPSGYSRSQSGYTITNTYTATTSSSVTKRWVDYNNKHNTRPANITLNLLRNGAFYKNVNITGTGDNWSYTENNLEKYDASGNAYVYTWEEPSVPNGYNRSQSGNTITNTLENTRYSMVHKIWKDNSNAYNTRPDSITLQLYQNGVAYGPSVVIHKETYPTQDDWSHSWHGLPKYDSNGDEYVYTWQEVGVPTGYSSFANGDIITNTLTGETQVSMEKVWIDNHNAYGTRPTSVDFEILRNGTVLQTVTLNGNGDNWTKTVTGLAKYDADGKEYTYSVREATSLTNYASQQSGNTVTNTLNVLMAVRGTKRWVDNSNAYNTRPNDITLKLYKTIEGQSTKTEVIATPTWSKEGDVWSYEFTNLPMYENGIKLTYSIDETAPENYTRTINGFDITNKLSGKVEIRGTKTWKYLGAPDRVRPSEITVVLLQNGEEYDSQTVAAGETIADENDEAVWEFVFTDLDKYDENGVLYEYTIDEVDVEFYETTIDEYDITNTYQPNYIDIYVNKVWLNDDESDRPGEIKVKLLRDGELYEEVTLDNESGWEYTWEDLDENYEYTVEESFQIPGYYPGVVTGDVEHGFTIENRKIVNPSTADNIPIVLAGLAAASMIGGSLLFVLKRRV